jgi:hypothetical protein
MLEMQDGSLRRHQLHNPPASGHFADETETASKPLRTEGYCNKSMGFIGLSDMVIRRANGRKIST